MKKNKKKKTYEAPYEIDLSVHVGRQINTILYLSLSKRETKTDVDVSGYSKFIAATTH